MITLLLVALLIFGGLIINKASYGEMIEQGGYFLANSFLLQSWIPWRDGYFSFNAVSWYLSTAFFSYFLFPWIFQTIQSKDEKKVINLAGITLSLMIIIAIVLGIGQQNWGWSSAIRKWVTYICPAYRVGDFIIGLVTGYAFVTSKKLERKMWYTVAEIVVAAIMIIQVILYNGGILRSTHWILTLFWLPTSVLCIYLFSCEGGAVSRFLSRSKVLVWIGNISAEAFLIHQICIKAAEYLTKNKWHVAAIAFLTTLIGTVIWQQGYRKLDNRLVERHKERLGKGN